MSDAASSTSEVQADCTACHLFRDHCPLQVSKWARQLMRRLGAEQGLILPGTVVSGE